MFNFNELISNEDNMFLSVKPNDAGVVVLNDYKNV